MLLSRCQTALSRPLSAYIDNRLNFKIIPGLLPTLAIAPVFRLWFGRLSVHVVEVNLAVDDGAVVVILIHAPLVVFKEAVVLLPA